MHPMTLTLRFESICIATVARGVFALPTFRTLDTMAAPPPPSCTDTSFRHTMYRAERRIDPMDGKNYTWTVLADWYQNKGWTMKQINQYWSEMDHHSVGRTRTKKKLVYADNHPLLKKRQMDTANGSKWEAW